MERVKIIVAHPNRQHSFRLATALYNEGILYKYITTVYDKPSSMTRIFKNVLGEKYKKKIEGKYCNQLEDDIVKQYYELSGLIFLVMIRIPFLKKYYRKFGTYINKRFGIKVAKYAIKNNVSAIVMYDTTADACFSYLKEKAPNIKRILDMSSVASNIRVRIYEKEMRITNSEFLKKENSHLWNKEFNERNAREILNSNYFLSPSSFVTNSLIKNDVDAKKIYLLRYGVDIKKFVPVPLYPSESLHIVFSGGITYGKGVNYLLQAMDHFGDELTLDLLGDFNKESRIFQEYKNKNNINFHGFVSQDKLREIYQKAHIFVFPSLGEGFSLAALEALASGIPVICSTNSGINDVIENRKNGIVFTTGNLDELVESIEWIFKNKASIQNMGKEARKSAEKLTWDEYNKEAVSIMLDIMKG